MCSDGGKSCGCSYDAHSGVRTCICLPSSDRYMITAQILSIVACLVSYFWWLTFLIGLVCLILLQSIWCCGKNRTGLYISAGISFMAAVTCIFGGIRMIVSWKGNVWCDVFFFGYGYEDDDECKEVKWAIVAFVAATLWFVTSGCILYFVKSGRHSKWEEKVQAADTGITTTVATTPTTTAIEMGTVQHHHHDDNEEHHYQHQQSGTIAVTTTSPIAATSYVLPDISDKIDDV